MEFRKKSSYRKIVVQRNEKEDEEEKHREDIRFLNASRSKTKNKEVMQCFIDDVTAAALTI